MTPSTGHTDKGTAARPSPNGPACTDRFERVLWDFFVFSALGCGIHPQGKGQCTATFGQYLRTFHDCARVKHCGHLSGCPFSNKVDGLAKRAAATHLLRLRPWVLRRPRPPLAASKTRNIRPRGGSVVARPQQTIARTDNATNPVNAFGSRK